MATKTFNYTGATQTWIVPVGVSSIVVECWGAQGSSGSSSKSGGKGGYAKGTLSVTAGETLRAIVGGQAGWPNGGSGGSVQPRPWGTTARGGSGGGSSDVRQGGSTTSSRKIVAAGGGGAGDVYVAYNGSSYITVEGAGGAGGAATGASGSSNPDGGGGGSQSSGGSHGGGNYSGGNGHTDYVYDGSNEIGWAGGGGGGGFYAGGGGGASKSYAGGGGGGANYVGGVSSTTSSRGSRSGNGLVRFTYYATPTQPGAFVYPVSGTIAYDTQEIEWGASTDADNDLAGYDIDYSSNNGSSWSRIITGTNMPYGKPFDFSGVAVSTTAKLRVRARDAGGRVSSWRESATFEVQHNQGPSPPIVQTPNNSVFRGDQSNQVTWAFQSEFVAAEQTAFDIRYRPIGFTEWNNLTGGSQESYTFNSNTLAKVDYEWQVRTTDNQGMVSGWSTLQYFTVERPHKKWGLFI